jgi:hypothetical protein
MRRLSPLSRYRPAPAWSAAPTAFKLNLTHALGTALATLLLGAGTAPARAQGAVAGAMSSAQAVVASTVDTLAQGWDQGHWRAAVSPYAPHLRYSPEHEYVWALAVERQRTDRWMAGASFFSNSFGQPSSYLYLGRRFPSLMGHPQLFGQVSGGLLYGYRGKYEKKVPFNYNGFSPGALASIGWQFNRQASLTVHAVGDAAVMFQFGWDFR